MKDSNRESINPRRRSSLDSFLASISFSSCGSRSSLGTLELEDGHLEAMAATKRRKNDHVRPEETKDVSLFQGHEPPMFSLSSCPPFSIPLPWVRRGSPGRIRLPR